MKNERPSHPLPKLKLRRLQIDTYDHSILFMRPDSPILRSEGFGPQARVEVHYKDRSVIATLNMVSSALLGEGEVGLSESAWKLLDAKEGDLGFLSHPKPLDSLAFVRAKMFGKPLGEPEMNAILADIMAGRYADAHLSAFITACAAQSLGSEEIVGLTRAMIRVGKQVHWDSPLVVDKHCVGGLPGNRTTPIIVPIIASLGLVMPKTSSRAITSPAGTADTMETLAPVELSLVAFRRVVEKEGGCVVWGGAVYLSPADDIIIRIERALDVDTEGQMVASVLSKKAAAGATHVIIDIPVGPTAKVRTREAADRLKEIFLNVSAQIGIKASVVLSDGMQPVGRGIGPALEARDILQVLRQEKGAPRDLEDSALQLAAGIIELAGRAKPGEGEVVARETLSGGQAWKKFQAICEAQGGMRVPPAAEFTHEVVSVSAGKVSAIDNRRLANVAKLAGAPMIREAGVELLAPIGAILTKGEPMFRVHAGSRGELDYALGYVNGHNNIITLEEEE